METNEVIEDKVIRKRGFWLSAFVIPPFPEALVRRK